MRTTERSFVLSPQIRRIAIVVVLGTIMSIIDTTIVNIALDTLSHQLHSTINTVQWVVTGYLLALAAVIPLCPWAVRRFSAKRVYIAALLLFTAGSALCAFASSIGELIAFRAVQGFGGGLLLPTGMTILVRAVGRDNLSKVMGFVGFPAVLAPVAGPTLGGLLLQSVGWHAIFLINVPVGVLTYFVARRLLPADLPERGDARHLDWQGLCLAATGMVGITYGLSESASASTFASRSVIGPIALGVLLIAMFVVRARRIPRPLLDLQLYRIPSYNAATVVMFCVSAAQFAMLILLPLYFQVARGFDAVHTGLLLIPQGVGAAFGMLGSNRATHRIGAGLTALFGGVLVLAASIPFVFVTASTSSSLLSVLTLVRGLGAGLTIIPSMAIAFNGLSHDAINEASPQINVLQRVGGSLGTAIVAVLLEGKLLHLTKGASSSTISTAFAHTYFWLAVFVLVALIPTLWLWRIERKDPIVDVREDLAMEAL